MTDITLKNKAQLLNRHRVLLSIFLIQIIILIALLIHIFTAPTFSLLLTPSDVVMGDKIEWEENQNDDGIILKSSFNENGTPVEAFSIEGISLDPGYYRIIANIKNRDSSTYSGTLSLSSQKQYFEKEVPIDPLIKLGSPQEEFHISTPTDDFEIKVLLNPEPACFLFKSITIARVGRLYLFLKIFIPFVLIDIVLLLLFTNVILKTGEQKIVALFLLLTVLVSSAPLVLDYITSSELGGTPDLLFHLKRIVLLSNDMVNTFPVRIHPDAFNGYGGIVPVFYGELLLYIPAILIRWGFPVWISYNYYILFINIAATLITFFMIYKISRSLPGSIAGCMLYVCFPYRISGIYVGSTVGEFSASAFIPLIFYACWLLIYETDIREKSRTWIYLFLGATLLLQTHILTTEICCVAFTIFLIASAKKTLFDKENMMQLLKGGAAFFLCNLWFIVPFVYMYTRNILNINVVTNPPEGYGMNLMEMFSFIPPGWGSAIRYTMIGDSGDIFGFSYGIILVIILIVFILYKDNIAASVTKLFNPIVAMGMISTLFIFAASNYMPWNLFLLMGIEKIAYAIQYPSRLFCIPAILLSICCGLLYNLFIEKGVDKKILLSVITTLVLLNTITVSGLYTNLFYSGIEVKPFTIDDNAFTLDGLYLPRGTFTDNAFNREIRRTAAKYGDILEGDDFITAEDLSKFDYGNTLTFHVSNEEDVDGVVLVPKYYYPIYSAHLEDGSRLQTRMHKDGRLAINLPKGCSGNVTVKFDIPVMWRICDIISLMSIIALATLFVVKKRGQRIIG